MRKYREKQKGVTSVTPETVTKVKPPQNVTPRNSNTAAKPGTGHNIQWHPEVDQSIFDGHGRMSPVNGYVLISLGAVPDGQPECGVVTEAEWRERLKHKCSHGFWGWSCKKCL